MKNQKIKITGSYSIFKSLIHIVLCNADYICSREERKTFLLFYASKIETHLHLSRLFQNKIKLRYPGKKYSYSLTIHQAEIIKEALDNFKIKSMESNHTFFIPNFLKNLNSQIATKKIEVIEYVLHNPNK